MATLKVTHDGGCERLVSLKAGAQVIGSGQTTDVVLDDEGATNRHCILMGGGGKWSVQDLDSDSGTWVNGSMILGRHPLSDGDQIRIGETVLTLDVNAVLAPAPELVSVGAAVSEAAPAGSASATPSDATQTVDPPAAATATSKPAESPPTKTTDSVPTPPPPLFATDTGGRKTLPDHIESLSHGRLPWRKAVSVALEIAQILEKADDHDVVHGGIEPGCLFMGRDRKWGLAAKAEPWPEGDPAYFKAPEVLEGEEPTQASDLYSLGAILYWMIAGRTAFKDTPVEDLGQRIAFGKPDPIYWVVTGLPKRVSNVIGKLMASHADGRYRSPSAVVRDLENQPATQPVNMVSAPVKRKSGVKGGWIAAVLVLGVAAWGISRFAGDAEEAAGALGAQVSQGVDKVKKTLDKAGPDAGQEGRSAEVIAAARVAKTAVDAVDRRANGLGGMSPATKAAWLEIADAYEALIQEHDPSIPCIQQGYLRSRLIRTDVARIDAATEPAEEVQAAVDDVIADIEAEIASAGADVLPPGLAETALLLPNGDVSRERLNASWDATRKLATSLRERGRSGDALRTVGLWLHRVRPLAEAKFELRRALKRGETWFRQAATEDTAILNSDLGSDLRLLRRAYGATRLIDNGMPVADEDGAGPCFGKALYALDGILPLLRTPALSERAARRRRRMDSALKAWSGALAAIPAGLVKDGHAISGIPGRGTVYVDTAVDPSLRGLPVRDAEDGDAEVSLLPWTEVPSDVIAREFVLPFAARGGHGNQAGAVWLLVALERPEEAELALGLGEALDPEVTAALEAEIAALRRLRTLGAEGMPETRTQTAELLATDAGFTGRPDLATSWDRLLLRQGLSGLLEAGDPQETTDQK